MSSSYGSPVTNHRVCSPFSEIEDLPTEMVYEQGSVSQKIIKRSSNDRRARTKTVLIPGRLFITENSRGTYIEWKAETSPRTDHKPQASSAQDLSILNGSNNGVGYRAAFSSKDHGQIVFTEQFEDGSSGDSHRNLKLDLTEIRSFVVTPAKHGDPEELVLYLTDGSLQNPFVFEKGSPNNLISALHRYVVLEQTARNRNSYIVKPRRESYPSPPSITDLLPDSARSVLGYVNDFSKDPKGFSTTMLAKVGGVVVSSTQSYIQSQLNLSPPNMSPSPESESERRNENLFPKEPAARHDCGMTTNDEGYEVVFKPDKFIELTPRPETFRGQQLSQEQWLDYMDNDGRIKNFEDIKLIVFRGGVDMNIKKPVWPFLLGLYDIHSTYEERKIAFREKKMEYEKIKNQWMTVSLDQESRFHAFRDFKSLIEKDVARTDRTLEFFKGENNPGTETLQKILMTYMMYNFNLGYVQGMSDILAPILMEVQDEVEAFWLFVKFMDRINSNFEMSQEGMKQQLSDMYTILQIVDPMFSAYLDACDASNMFFAFRWMLILFKREFDTCDTMTLWEAFWTELPGPNFHLIFGVAILEEHRDILMENKYGLSEILRHLNDLSGRINLENALKLAEGIYLQLKENRDRLTDRALEILGLPKPERAVVVEPSTSQTVTNQPSRFSVEGSFGDQRERERDLLISCSAIELDQDERLENQYEASVSQFM